jgi:ATP-dependent DNA helicase RecQ
VQQVSALLRRKIPSTFINSDLGSVEKGIRYQLLANKSLKLLYAAPERFFVQNKRELQMLQSLRPSFLVIDEAHCVDQWGRDFRPEYGRLDEVRKVLGSPPVLAFTATAGQEMQKRILASLGVNDARAIVRGVDRPNIRWEVLGAEGATILRSGDGIYYVRTVPSLRHFLVERRHRNENAISLRPPCTVS